MGASAQHVDGSATTWGRTSSKEARLAHSIGERLDRLRNGVGPLRCESSAATVAAQPVPFAAQECGACGAALGYVTEDRTLRMLLPSNDPATYEVVGHDGQWWRCMNSAWGCNWMLPAGSDTVWCRSCRLTRGRPDGERPDAVEAWVTAEAAKRRLVHQLDALGLLFEMRSTSTPDGLVFDLVHLPGERGITGHFDGVVTLDLAEADDRYRDDLRRQLGESFRTVIGHLRHEVGHYFWSRLVGRSDRLSAFRSVFGDERIDYREAVATYYAGGAATWDASRHVTAYAASHPLEDWAETFAHYLHIVDVADTAAAHDFVAARRRRDGDDRSSGDRRLR